MPSICSVLVLFLYFLLIFHNCIECAGQQPDDRDENFRLSEEESASTNHVRSKRRGGGGGHGGGGHGGGRGGHGFGGHGLGAHGVGFGGHHYGGLRGYGYGRYHGLHGPHHHYRPFGRFFRHFPFFGGGFGIGWGYDYDDCIYGYESDYCDRYYRGDYRRDDVYEKNHGLSLGTYYELMKKRTNLLSTQNSEDK
ncbi:hypothetical protein QR680_016194 [Steinernema hermaphroditum]|uniref:Uncharacterized protein n=1 Tax=Steinernema hermaphroditum TaxID=289476 RepID=A0AA39HCC1_9BILA|nr:hypothetical protein QR680_016194 [Steinernema hermaphroditum]